MKLKMLKTISAVAASSFIVGSASAASLAFDGGTGDWDQTTTNWNGGTAAFNDGDDVTFGGAGGTVSVAVDVAPGSITYSSNNNSIFLSSGGVITGTGSLIKNGSGTMEFGNGGSSMANTFSGGTLINSGTLRINRGDISNPLGAGDITLAAAGQIYLWRANMANNLIVNGGSLISSNGFGNNWNGGVALNATLDLNMHFNMNVNGVIAGTGGLNVNPALGGSSTVFLNAANTYTGATTVFAKLGINGTSLDDSSSLLIETGGLVTVSGGVERVGSLTLGGIAQTAPGTYGSTSSGADFQNDTFFGGSGVVEIVAIPEPSSTALLGLGGLALLLRRRK